MAFISGITLAEIKPIGKDTKFPAIFFKNNLSKESQTYLGISTKKSFSLKDISANLFVIEIFSTYCTSCPKNVPILNTVYDIIENDAELKGKIKVLSIAVGNTLNEVQSYKKGYRVLFPIATDTAFAAHKALGNPRVPYTIFVKKNVKGKCMVVGSHQGVIDSVDSIINSIRDFLP